MVVLGAYDFWPPTLQSQREQLQAEVRKAEADRAKLERQAHEATTSKDELQVRLDELTRLNRDLTERLSNLEQSLALESAKVAKLAKKMARMQPRAKPLAEVPTEKKLSKDGISPVQAGTVPIVP